MAKIKRVEREVPTEYRSVFQFETFFRPTWNDRWKILLGKNLNVVTTVYSQWKCGKFRPDVTVKLTDQKAPLGGEEAYDGYMGTPISNATPKP